MTINTVFPIILVVFIAILIGLASIGRKWVSDTSDLLVAGREVSFPMAVIGVMAIGFAGTTVTLCPGFTILYGFNGSAAWDIIYCTLGLMFYGVAIAPFARRSGAQTLPEFLEIRYNKNVRSIVAVTMLIGMCGLLANNLTSCVNTIYGFTGWNRTLMLAGLFIIVLIFTSFAGLWSTTFTDTFQVILGCVVVPTVLVLLAQRFGLFEAINANWPGGDSFSAGLTGDTLPMGELTYPSFINFIVCFGLALVWGSNLYWLRSACSRNEKVAKKSFLVGGFLTLIIFFLPFSVVGQYAGAFLTENFVQVGGTYAETEAYGLLARTFNPIFGSICVIGAVAASISTSSSNVMGASSIATRDVYQRLKPNTTPAQRVRAGRYIMALVVVATWILCQFPGGNTYLFAFANCWLVPPAILIGLGAVWPRLNSTGAKWGALSGMVVMAVFTLLGTVLNIFNIDEYIYTASLGFIVTLVVTVIVTLCTTPEYYAAKGWERVPNEHNRENVVLDENAVKVLELLRVGHSTMAELTDAMGVDSGTTIKAVQVLDKGGYLVRQSLWGKGFYTFDITPKGISKIALNEQEEKLAALHLTPVYVDILKILAQNPQNLGAYLQEKKIPGMRVTTISYRLSMDGYIREKGMFRRKLEITDKGREVLKSVSTIAAG